MIVELTDDEIGIIRAMWMDRTSIRPKISDERFWAAMNSLEEKLSLSAPMDVTS